MVIELSGAQHEVQLPLYYSHFEYQKGAKRLSKLEMMQYRAKIVRFKTEMTRFRTDVI